MKKTAEQIAQYVLGKLSVKYAEDRVEDPESRPTTLGNNAIRAIGAGGGGILGGLFGGVAGAGLGSAMRGFPGYKPSSTISKALSKTIRNPVGHTISTALPFMGLGTGIITGARKGSELFDDVSNELSEADMQRLLDIYLERMG